MPLCHMEEGGGGWGWLIRNSMVDSDSELITSHDDVFFEAGMMGWGMSRRDNRHTCG